MKVIFTEPFRRDYRQLPSNVQGAIDKALAFLFTNPRHPSLQAKKLPGASIWYARVSREHRFTFQYSKDVVILRRVGSHAILIKERK